jgi:hypothetical protein
MVNKSHMFESSSENYTSMRSDPTKFTQLRGKHSIALLFSALITFFLHVVMGANPIAICTVLLTLIFGVYPVFRCGFLNIGALLILLAAFRYVGFPLISKLMFLQPLDSNLVRPIGSFFTVLLGILSYLFAFQIAARLELKQNILTPTTDPDQLKLISAIAMTIGCAANFGVATHIGTDFTGIAVANFFVPFLHLAFISAIAAVLCESGGQRSWNNWVLLILLTEIAFALVRNSRMALVEVVISYVLTLTAFHGKVKWSRIGLSVFIVSLMVIVITPFMLQVRTIRSNLTWNQRITATFGAMSNWRTALEYYKTAKLFQSREEFYLNYYGSSQNILERTSLINHVDVLKSATDKHNTVGLKDLRQAFKRVLPRFIAPSKPIGHSHGDWLYCMVNVRCSENSYATVPLIANGYAAMGWLGVVLYPLIFGFLLFFIIHLVSGLYLLRNVWAIYLFIRVHNIFVEGSSASYLQAILRDIPQDVILFIVIAFFLRVFHPISSYRVSSGPSKNSR